jgi:hypothetical protein
MCSRRTRWRDRNAVSELEKNDDRKIRTIRTIRYGI